MLGARWQYELANLLVVNLRQRLHYAYLQDNFKVSPRLTLNLGMRYEFSTPIYEDQNRLSNYDPQTNSIIRASGGSLSDRGLVDPDYNNFAPRIGFAYTLLDKTVLRGGYGIGYVHFNRLGSADLLATNFPQITRANITQDASNIAGGLCTGDIFAGCLRTTQQGYPSALPNNVTLYIPRDKRTPYIQNWQLSIQHESDIQHAHRHRICGRPCAQAGAARGCSNQARPLTLSELALPAAQRPTLDQRRPIQGFRSISAVLPVAFSNYNTLQIKFERRFAKGLYVLNSFTWSKAIDNVSQVLEEPNGNEGRPQNVYNIGADRGPSAYDQPFNNTTSFVWELPFGRGRAFGGDMSRWLDGVVGGWTLTGINSMLSGQTINLRYQPSPVTANLATFLGGVALRPNISGPVLAPDDQRTIDNYFDRNNISLPTVDSPFGSAGRNIARSDSFFQFDTRITEEFPFADK